MMITDVEDYFTKGCGRCARFATPDCSIQPWQGGLVQLRRICREMGLTETVKWGHPCYMHGSRNIAGLGAFRSRFQIWFFNPALMADPERVLERQGPNTLNPDMISFTYNDQVAVMEPVIRTYLAEAIGYAEAGIKPARVVREVEWPEELVEALEADPALGDAFHALTPGRQKSYAFNLNSAKKRETRLARIAKFRDKIFAGKGALDR